MMTFGSTFESGRNSAFTAAAVEARHRADVSPSARAAMVR